MAGGRAPRRTACRATRATPRSLRRRPAGSPARRPALPRTSSRRSRYGPDGWTARTDRSSGSVISGTDRERSNRPFGRSGRRTSMGRFAPRGPVKCRMDGTVAGCGCTKNRGVLPMPGTLRPGPSLAAMVLAIPRTDAPLWKSAVSGTSTPSLRSTSSSARTASREWPPRSKKLASTSTCSTHSTRAQMRASVAAREPRSAGRRTVCSARRRRQGGQRPPVHLAAGRGGQGRQRDEGRGDHVVGQAASQLRAQGSADGGDEPRGTT